MNNLIIIGAGGFGREVACYAEECVGFGEHFQIKGFIDNNTAALDTFIGYPPVLGTVDDYQPAPDDVFCCAIASIVHKEKCIDTIRKRGGKFVSLIHRNSKVDKNSTIGNGCIICHGVYVNCDATIGDFVVLQNDCMIGHDSVIGSHCHLHPRVFVGGGVTIERGTLIGACSTILPYKTVGTHSRIGAAANVTKDVLANTTIVGNPARILYHKGSI